MAPQNVTVSGNQVSVTTSEGDALRQSQQAGTSNPLDTLTLAQALTWIDANVTDLNSARLALKQLAKLLFILRADVQREKSRHR
jgi:hypothetical protein